MWKTRTIQRKPIGDRWHVENAKMVTGVPWNVSDQDEKADGDKMEVIKVNTDEAARQVREKEFGDLVVPRRWNITKNVMREHGCSATCEGCRAALAGRQARQHSEECRARLRGLLKDDPRMKDTEKRLDDFLEKIAEREGQKELEKTERENGVGAGDEEMKPEDEAKGDGSKTQKARAASPDRLSGTEAPTPGTASGSGLTEEQRKRSLLSDVRLAEEESQKAARRFEKDRVGADNGGS